MVKADYTKLIVAVVAIAAAVVLAVAGTIEGGVAMGLIGTVVGVILGNGKSIAQGDRPGTVLTRTDVRSRADDRTIELP